MKKLKFLVSLRRRESSYQKQNATAVAEVASRLGVEVEIVYAGNDAIGQSEQLLKVIQSPPSSRPDGILCAPVGTTMQQVARSAAAAGIGWAVLSREVFYIEELRRTYPAPVFSVRIDHKEVGRIQARQMAALLPQGGVALCLLGPSAHPNTEERLSSLLAAKPANVQLKTLSADWTQQGAQKAVTRWLRLRTTYDAPVNLIAAQNDEMAIGARQAFKDEAPAGELDSWMRLPYLGSVCCPDTGPEWIRQGLLTASIINPSTANIALEMMVRAIQTHTQPLERRLLSPTSYPEIEKLAARKQLQALSS
ncbi:MAG TPA: substrate-binding domain-containing protein [Terriglobales bacterium]|nr:substrate-binding domain-containing protein [Terriglobales bacterium]